MKRIIFLTIALTMGLSLQVQAVDSVFATVTCPGHFKVNIESASTKIGSDPAFTRVSGHGQGSVNLPYGGRKREGQKLTCYYEGYGGITRAATYTVGRKILKEIENKDRYWKFEVQDK